MSPFTHLASSTLKMRTVILVVLVLAVFAVETSDARRFWRTLLRHTRVGINFPGKKKDSGLSSHDELVSMEG